MKPSKILDRLYRTTALRMTGADRIGIDIRWGEVKRVGPCWLASVNFGLTSATGVEQWTSIVGYAIDRSRRMLSIKALMEALESLAGNDSQLQAQSRTGFAAHFTEDEARSKAYQELIERDAFLFHWLSETPAERLDWRRHRRRTGDLSVILPAESGELRCLRLRSADPGLSVCMAASRMPAIGCWHVGLGVDKDEGQALAKATREWLGLVHGHRFTDGRCVSPTLPDGRPNVCAGHHIGSRDERVSALLEHLTSASPPAASGAQADSAAGLRAATRFSPLRCRSPRYSVVLAENPRLLPLWFAGRFEEARAAYLDNARLQAALPARYRFHSAERFVPHPIN